MVVVGFIASLVAGILWWPWWTAIITTVVVIVAANAATDGGVERRGGAGNPLVFVWMAIPQFVLWGIGSWIGGLFR